MYNCRSYSNATSIDLSKYDERGASYYNPPLVSLFKCPQVEGLTKEQKQKFIDNYIKEVNRWFNQLKHNITQAKKFKETDLEKNFQRHYNYHLAQRGQAQKCRAILMYGGDTSSVKEVQMPKPEPKPQPKPTPTPTPKPDTVSGFKEPSYCDVNPNDPKCKGGIDVVTKDKAEPIKKEGFSLSKDLMIGLLAGIVLYLVVLK